MRAAAIGRGTVLAERYQIEEVLGTGGSGSVFRAWDRVLGELVAIKVLHPARARERSWIRRLAREVKVARAIRHPNVCRVFELGQSQGHWYVTMELATGGSLRDSLRRQAAAQGNGGASAAAGAAPPVNAAQSGGAASGLPGVKQQEHASSRARADEHSQFARRSLDERLADVRALCAGLSAIHAVGITHRDVTPQNVLRMGDGRLVLTDFGLAIEHDAHTTVHGGTPAYLPPEVARGERSDQRSDVFQLGLIMHEVMVGGRPTWGQDGRAQLADPRPGSPPVEEEITRLMEACLDPDPARRPPTAVAVAGRLAAAEAARAPNLAARLVRRTRRFARRHRSALIVTAGVIALAGLVRTVQVLSRPPLCASGDQQLADVWDPARAEVIRRAFLATKKPYAAESFTKISEAMGKLTQRWRAMYVDACQATHVRGEQSVEVLDLRMACLGGIRNELGALSNLLASADGELVSHAVQATAGLTDVRSCADVASLRSVVRPPEDAAQRARVDDIRRRAAELKALLVAGRLQEGIRRARPLVEEARRTSYEPLMAEVLLMHGRFELWARGAPDETARLLDEALLRAEASRHDRVLAEASIDRLGLIASHETSSDTQRFAMRAQAILRRLGGDARLESWLHTAVAFSFDREGKHVEALDLHRKALSLKLQVLGHGDQDVGISLGNVANQLTALGRPKEALVENERALAIMQASFGEHHPEVARHLYNRGEIRLALGQTSGAREDFERAYEVMRAEYGAEVIDVSYPPNGIGLSYLAEGGAEAAGRAVAPLREALRIREKVASAPELRSETMFALARALWESGQDRTRARSLATEALALAPASGQSVERRRIMAETLARWGGDAKRP